jgi:hypothetical protein
MFFLIAFLDKAFIKNMIILCINHIIIICINDNNSVINRIYGRFKDLILFFKIPMGMWTDFFRTCRKFKHVPSERCVSLEQCIFYYHLLYTDWNLFASFTSSAVAILCMVVQAFSPTQFWIQSSTCCVWTICHPDHSAATNPYVPHSLRQWPMLIKFHPSGIWQQEMYPGQYDMLQFNGNRHGQTYVSTVSMNVYLPKTLSWNWIHKAALSHHTANWQREICIAGIAPALPWHFSFKRATTWK